MAGDEPLNNLGDFNRPLSEGFNEWRSPEGLRTHWEPFVRAFDKLGPAERAQRWAAARRVLRDHGVTYSPTGLERPWELDSIPLIISRQDWQGIESGLAQRARLLNAIVADIYGPQRLLQERLVPPSLIFPNPNYYRPLHDVRVPQNLYLHFYAAEVAHSTDGEWCVMADRTQTASGSGYALENRNVIANSIPDVLRSCNVERLTGFFEAQRRLMSSLSPRSIENPRIVFLTPGTRTQTHFEHAYLARHLGFTLVEGSDLTVRDDRVFLKTLEGLRPVDVIFRKIDDAVCDPLELPTDSFYGVVGLVQAARAGNVAIANALGSSLAESPSFLPFLPGLCAKLLGEDLHFPSVPTWWCGQPDSFQYVIEHMQDLVIKPAYNTRGAEPVFVRELTAPQRESLIAQMRARPNEFVAQQIISLSSAPIAAESGWEIRPVMLRAFAVANSANQYTLMPGGLTRVMAEPKSAGVGLMHHADGSKDTWVLSDGRSAEQMSLVGWETTPVIHRGSTDLPSRIADDLFWIGRYAERAEATVRLVRVVLERLGTESTSLGATGLQSLLQILDSLGLMTMTFGRRKEGLARALEMEVLSIIYKQQRPGSLRDTLNRLHRIVAPVRDRLSSDTWRILNQLHQSVARPEQTKRQDGDVQALLNGLITSLAAFNGMEMENMTRGYGWRFLDMGRRLERSLQMIGLLRAALPEMAGKEDRPVLEALLDIADSSMTYRSRYYTTVALGPVMDVLIADESNPRSLAFQLTMLRQHVQRLPRDPRAPSPTREEYLAGELLKQVDQKLIQEHCRARLAGDNAPLDDRLGKLFDDTLSLSNAVTHYYFSHAERGRSAENDS